MPETLERRPDWRLPMIAGGPAQKPGVKVEHGRIAVLDPGAGLKQVFSF